MIAPNSEWAESEGGWQPTQTVTNPAGRFWVHRSAEEVAAAKGTGVVVDPNELVMPNFWESDEELNTFIADVYASRTSA